MCITTGGYEATHLHSARRKRYFADLQREKTRKLPHTLRVSPDEAVLFRYEIYYVWLAAQNVQSKPARDLGENLELLNEKIKALNERIEKVFGKLADESKPG